MSPENSFRESLTWRLPMRMLMNVKWSNEKTVKWSDEKTIRLEIGSTKDSIKKTRRTKIIVKLRLRANKNNSLLKEQLIQ